MAVALAVVAAVGSLAYVLGEATHPAVGWFVVVVAVGGPAGYAAREWWAEYLKDKAAAAREARGRDVGVPADMRGDSGPGGRLRAADRDEQDDEEGAPGRTW